MPGQVTIHTPLNVHKYQAAIGKLVVLNIMPGMLGTDFGSPPRLFLSTLANAQSRFKKFPIAVVGPYKKVGSMSGGTPTRFPRLPGAYEPLVSFPVDVAYGHDTTNQDEVELATDQLKDWYSDVFMSYQHIVDDNGDILDPQNADPPGNVQVQSWPDSFETGYFQSGSLYFISARWEVLVELQQVMDYPGTF